MAKNKINLDLTDDKKSTIDIIHHIVILDESGSMASVQKQTMDGVNENIKSIKKDQKDSGIKQTFSLVVFSDSDKYREVYWAKPIEDVKSITAEDYNPVGSTALLDAIGITVTKAKNAFAEKLTNKTAAIMMTVMTDGEENTSKEFKHDQIQTIVKDLQDDQENGWTIAYMGAAPKAVEIAKNMGFVQTNAVQYTSSQAGTASAFQCMSVARSCYVDKLSKGLNAKSEFFNNLPSEDEDESNNLKP